MVTALQTTGLGDTPPFTTGTPPPDINRYHYRPATPLLSVVATDWDAAFLDDVGILKVENGEGAITTHAGQRAFGGHLRPPPIYGVLSNKFAYF